LLLLLVVDKSHWLGLYHTFQDGCGGQGDKNDDALAKGESYAGCKPSQNLDTCPSLPGINLIHNFMDYSYNVCLYLFTVGQVVAMRNNVAMYCTLATQMV